jgi:hypothetical protein
MGSDAAAEDFARRRDRSIPLVFWFASGFIALVIAFPATKAILTSHGFPPAIATPLASA